MFEVTRAVRSIVESTIEVELIISIVVEVASSPTTSMVNPAIRRTARYFSRFDSFLAPRTLLLIIVSGKPR